MYKHSITSVSLPGTLAQKIKAVAKAGYDGIELFENDFTISDLKPSDLYQMVTDLGIEVAALQPFRDYEAMPQHLHLKNLDRAEYKFDLMEKIGTKRLFVCSNCSPHAINDIDLAAEQLYTLAERAAKRGFQIAYEALSWGRFVNLYHQSIEIVKRANHPNLGNLLDSYHIGFMGENMDAIRDIPKEKLSFVQVADAQYFDMSAIYVGRHLRCFPGQGTFPVEEYMKAVRATGYEGYISHEVFSDEFRAAPLEPTALDGKRSLVWLEGVTDTQQQLPRVENIEFIEFCTNAINQQNLVQLLTNIGFCETYRHRTKDVSLFQLGNINIVLNRQKQTIEKSENTVCAIGLNARSSLSNTAYWAKKLNYEWISSTDSPNQIPLPAIKGIGDILYYICPNEKLQYDIEFESTGKSKINNGITHIDHIGHTVGSAYYQANTLFYRAMMGLDIEESLDLFDPNGIVHSKVVKSKNNKVRISLSSTQNRNTSSDYFMTKLGGAGIQQIALATNDIFATATCIGQKEYILPIPANYYEDLKSKSILPLQVIAQMQVHHILFDQNNDGSFFHFYFKELNGLFIEIVQRTEQYDRYGEVNAQVRLAAQARNR